LEQAGKAVAIALLRRLARRARDPVRPRRHPYFASNECSDTPWKIISIGTRDYCF
jgi:hypothetical protein